MTYHLNLNPSLIPESQLQWMIENHQVENPEFYLQYLTLRKIEEMSQQQQRGPFGAPRYL